MGSESAENTGEPTRGETIEDIRFATLRSILSRIENNLVRVSGFPVGVDASKVVIAVDPARPGHESVAVAVLTKDDDGRIRPARVSIEQAIDGTFTVRGPIAGGKIVQYDRVAGQASAERFAGFLRQQTGEPADPPVVAAARRVVIAHDARRLMPADMEELGRAVGDAIQRVKTPADDGRIMIRRGAGDWASIEPSLGDRWRARVRIGLIRGRRGAQYPIRLEVEFANKELAHKWAKAAVVVAEESNHDVVAIAMGEHTPEAIQRLDAMVSRWAEDEKRNTNASLSGLTKWTGGGDRRAPAESDARSGRRRSSDRRSIERPDADRRKPVQPVGAETPEVTKEGPCDVCGSPTAWLCADCGIDSGGALKVFVCSSALCQRRHEARAHGRPDREHRVIATAKVISDHMCGADAVPCKPDICGCFKAAEALVDAKYTPSGG